MDSTEIILAQPYAVLLFCEDFSVPVGKWEKQFAKVYAAAMAKNIPAYLITTQPDKALQKLSATAFKNIQVLKCDYTAIRTAARTNPCVYILKQGTVVDKWSRFGFSAATGLLESLSTQPKPVFIEPTTDSTGAAPVQ